MNLRAIIVSLVVGALTVLLLTLYLRRLEAETSGGNPILVVAAVKPLEPGTIIAPDMLSFKACRRRTSTAATSASRTSRASSVSASTRR